MDHIRTLPNIFLAGRSYAPVSWDFSDLGSVCSVQLEDKNGRDRMLVESFEVLQRSHSYEWFRERVASMLDAAAEKDEYEAANR